MSIIKESQHPNYYLLTHAIKTNQPEEVTRIIRSDPRVLASWGYRSRRDPARIFYHSVLTEALRARHEEPLRALLACLADPAIAGALKKELKRQGCEDELYQGHAFYPMHDYPTDRHLPHQNSWLNVAGLRLLAEAGYDISLTPLGTRPLPLLMIGATLDKLQKVSENDGPAVLHELARRGIEINLSCSKGTTKDRFAEEFRTAFTHHSGISSSYNRGKIHEELARAGMDLRAMLSENPFQGFQRQDFAFKQESLLLGMRSEMWEGVWFRKESEKYKDALRISCAIGDLPRYLQFLVRRRDSLTLQEVPAMLSDYWRGEYRHSLRTAEAALARITPVEKSVLEDWVRG